MWCIFIWINCINCEIPEKIAVLPLDFVKIRSQGLSTMTTRKIIQRTRKTEGNFAFWKGFTAFTLRNPLPLIMVDVFSYLYLQKRLNWKEHFNWKERRVNQENQNWLQCFKIGISNDSSFRMKNHELTYFELSV